MIPSPHRHKGGASLLGASVAGQLGPFGRRPDENHEEPEELDDVDGGLGDEPEPEPESSSYAEQQVQQRITAAKVRIAAARERRESFAEARKHGLRHRHAAKLRHLRDAEQQRHEQQQDD